MTRGWPDVLAALLTFAVIITLACILAALHEPWYWWLVLWLYAAKWTLMLVFPCEHGEAVRP